MPSDFFTPTRSRSLLPCAHLSFPAHLATCTSFSHQPCSTYTSPFCPVSCQIVVFSLLPCFFAFKPPVPPCLPAYLLTCTCTCLPVNLPVSACKLIWNFNWSLNHWTIPFCLDYLHLGPTPAASHSSHTHQLWILPHDSIRYPVSWFKSRGNVWSADVGITTYCCEIWQSVTTSGQKTLARHSFCL